MAWELERREQDKNSQRPSLAPQDTSLGNRVARSWGHFSYVWGFPLTRAFCLLVHRETLGLYRITHGHAHISKRASHCKRVFIFLASCHLTFSSSTWNRTHLLWGLADTWVKGTLVMSWWLFISISIHSLTWISQIHLGGEIHILLSAREKSIN